MSSSKLMDRRSVLRSSTAIATMAAMPRLAFPQRSMITKTIPGTGEQLPVVGLGAPDIFINRPPEGPELTKAVLQAMVDAGGRLFDSPSFFRPDVPYVGPILQEMNLQDELFITGKITVESKEAGVEHLEKLTANLNRPTMDLLMVHNMRNLAEHWETLREWKDSGRTRYIGVSRTRTTDFTDLEEFMRRERPDFVMVGYSIHNPEAGERVLPLAADLGIGVLIVEAFKTYDDGALFGLVANQELPEWATEIDCESWAQFSLKFILGNPAVTGVVTETRQVRHVLDNMGAGYGRLPDAALRHRMSEHLLSL